MLLERQLTDGLNGIGLQLIVSDEPPSEESLPSYELRQTLWEIRLLLGH